MDSGEEASGEVSGDPFSNREDIWRYTMQRGMELWSSAKPDPLDAVSFVLQVVQEFIRFLHRLATTNKDCAVVMSRVGTKEALTKAMDKHNSNLLLVTELRDLVVDCEKYASLYKKMTTSILAGCIQVTDGFWRVTVLESK